MYGIDREEIREELKRSLEKAQLLEAAGKIVDAIDELLTVCGRIIPGKEDDFFQECVDGVDDFLAKPVRPIDVHNRMVAVLDRPRKYIKTGSGYFGPDRRRSNNKAYMGPDRRKKDDFTNEIDPRKAAVGQLDVRHEDSQVIKLD